MKRYVAIAVLVLLALVGGMTWLLGGTSKTDTSSVQTSHTTALQSQMMAGQGAVASQPTAVPSQDPALDTAAVLSLREGRVDGDSRAPPMSVPKEERDPPTQAQLDDPTAYAQYEHGEQMKVFQSYVNAVPQKVKTLQDALTQAAQPGSGVSQAQMDAARHKIELLKAMQAKLLSENPELTAPGGKAASVSSTTTSAAPASPTSP